ncbi:DUF4383 domain-containing protein [Hydrocarboniclastica marina]|uniref:DUF4383 domain-containing protein n=1 Tax=Hydrocarboniclastica marina TaxID=2259620 RepID=A0A4P7XJT4_9ALTE|nr:DUF4383 domain-containing protein [Hydrocarboniclastica marina]QCF26814.1 DUF4383 domain-containing protein [Hydrocarboniclastica marina]
MVKKFALIFGIVYAVVGVLGFIPALVVAPELSGDLAVEAGHGWLLGIFPVNVVHNLVHLGIGIWGILAAKAFASSVFYAKANAVIFALLAILGIIPATDTLFGLVPLYGNDIWLHVLNAVVAGYFGFGPPARADVHTSTGRV